MHSYEKPLTKGRRHGGQCEDSIISCIDADGVPKTRTMPATRKRDGIREFWLTTNASSQKVKRFKRPPKACLYFADRRFFRGVCPSGTAEALETSEAKKRIWRNGDEKHYPADVAAPDYCMLKFTAAKGAITAATSRKVLKCKASPPQNIV